MNNQKSINIYNKASSTGRKSEYINQTDKQAILSHFKALKKQTSEAAKRRILLKNKGGFVTQSALKLSVEQESIRLMNGYFTQGGIISVMNTASNFNDVTGQLENLKDSIGSSGFAKVVSDLDSIAKNLDTKESVKHGMETITNLLNTSNSTMESAKVCTKEAISLMTMLKYAAPALGITMYVLSQFEIDATWRKILRLLSTIILASCGLLFIVGTVSEKYETQSGENVLSSLATGLWCYYTNDSTKTIPQRITSFIGSYSHLSIGFGKLFELICKLFNEIFDGIAERYGFSGGSPDRRMRSFIEKAKKFVDQYNGDEVTRSLYNANRLAEIISEGEALSAMSPRDGVYTLSYFMRRLYQIQENFAQRKLTVSGLRVEPVAAIFKGAPGNFKTAIVQYISNAVIKEYLERIGDDNSILEFNSNPSAFTFNRASENVYWEGYDYKKIVCFFDDFGQTRDVPGNPDNEYMGFIRVKNEHEYVLHMATLEKKADTYFQSKYILMSSNLDHYDPQSIISRDALTRRFDFDYIVVPQDGHQDLGTALSAPMERKVDKTTLPRGELTSEIDPFSVVEFQRLNPNGTRTTVRFGEVVQELIDAQITKEQYFLQKKLTIHSTTRRLEPFIAAVRRRRQVDIVNLRFYETLKDVGVPPDLEHSDDEASTQSSNESNLSSVSLENSNGSQQNPQDWIRNHKEDFTEKVKTIPPGLAEAIQKKKDCLKAAKLFRELECLKYNACENWLRLSGVPESDLEMFAGEWYIQKMLGPDCLEDYPISDTEREFWEKHYNESTSYNKGAGAFLHVGKMFSKSFVYVGKQLNCSPIMSVIEKYFRAPVEFLSNMFGRIYEFCVMHKELIKGLALLGTGITILGLIYELIRGYFKPDGRAATEAPKDGETTPVLVTQSLTEFDSTTNNIVDKLLKENCFDMSMEYGETKAHFGMVTFVRTGVLMMPNHFVRQLNYRIDDDVDRNRIGIRLKSSVSKNLDYIIPYKTFIAGIDPNQALIKRDISFVKIDRCRPMRDITEFFTTRAYIARRASFNAALIKRTPGEIVIQRVVANRHHKAFYSSPLDRGNDTWQYEECFFYTASTTDGSCGMLIIDLSKQAQKGKIMGMHVAGKEDVLQGFSTIVTREDIQEVTSTWDCYMALPGPVELVTQSSLEERFIVLSDLEKSPAGPNKSAYCRTPLYGAFGPSKKSLSLLHPKIINGEMVDPMIKGLSNYGLPDVMVNIKYLDLAVECYANYLRINSKVPVDKVIMSEEEVIYGIEGDHTFNAMNRQSSMGYPWNLETKPGFKGKEFIFGKGDTYDIDNENYKYFKSLVDQKEVSIREGVRPEFEFTDNLKDEKLKKDKVREGKTRVFSGANCELVYLCRKYFGNFSRWYIGNKMFNGSAIGINVYSDDWDILARMLMNVGGHQNNHAYGAGDYSKFDGSEKNLVLWKICDIINEWYDDGPENCKMRERLWYEVVNSVHVVRGQKVMWTNSLPSGHPLTSIINSMYNNIAFRFAWNKINSVNNIVQAGLFDKNIYLITLGDDNIFAVSSLFRDRFNESTICEAMKELGLTYTSDTKEGVNLTLRTLKDITFLKRSFRFEPLVGKWVAPLDFDTLIQISYWCKKNTIIRDEVLDHIDNTILELSLYGKEEFERWIKEIRKVLDERLPGLEPRTMKWRSALEIALSLQKYY